MIHTVLQSTLPLGLIFASRCQRYDLISLTSMTHATFPYITFYMKVKFPVEFFEQLLLYLHELTAPLENPGIYLNSQRTPSELRSSHSGLNLQYGFMVSIGERGVEGHLYIFLCNKCVKSMGYSLQILVKTFLQKREQKLYYNRVHILYSTFHVSFYKSLSLRFIYFG